MEHYQIKDVTFTYPGSSAPAVQNVSFIIEEGAFTLLCGPSGSGKSTLLRQLKREVRPIGIGSGHVLFKGRQLDEYELTDIVGSVGMVFQDPDSGIVMDTVLGELVFAMENLGFSPALMQRRVAELAGLFDMEEWLHQPIHELSGGQKQLVSLASVMALRPEVLLLDEPTAQLDPIAAKTFIELLSRLNEEFGVTIVISEHRSEELIPLATQVLVMKEGRLAHDGAPSSVIRDIWRCNAEFLPYLPPVSRLYLEHRAQEEDDLRIPVTVKEGKRWLNGYESGGRRLSVGLLPAMMSAEENVAHDTEALLSCKELHFQYERDTPPVLKGLSLELRSRDCYALFGGNGSGKSTLLQLIAGAFTPLRGRMRYKGKKCDIGWRRTRGNAIGYVAQNPVLYFTRDTVSELLQSRVDQLRLPHGNDHIIRVADMFDLQSVMKSHPFDISGGQQQKVALAFVMLADPELLLLDEPTKGLDPGFKEKLAEQLHRLQGDGKTIMMATHDMPFAASYAGRCGLLFDGVLAAEEATGAFMSSNLFYTTVIHRLLGSFSESQPRQLASGKGAGL